METKLLHITQLLLDSENPRHDVIENQRDIIKQLLVTEKIDNLAQDIAEHGALSPLEAVGVMPLENRKNEYVVVEGNRRVCACMLLNDPNLSPTDTIRRKFETLRKNNNVPSEVRCTVFKTRDDADHWIQLRHEGQQDGRGTKSWDATQIARYADKRGRKNQNIQAIKILDFAADRGIIAPGDKGGFSITTLQRYLSNPVFRNVLGLENKEDLQSRHDRETFQRFITRFLSDAKPDGEVNSRSKGKDWVDYANKLQSEIADPPPDTNPLIDHGKEDSEKSKDNSGKEPKPKSSKPDPAKRKNLIPYNVRFAINDKFLNRLYLEMRKLEVEVYEFSAAYLLRAFIEGSIIRYMEKYLPDEAKKEMKLHQKILKVSEHLQKNGVKKGILQPLNVAASDQNSILSPLNLGAMVHLTIIPTKRELLGVWDRLEGALKEIHARLA